MSELIRKDVDSDFRTPDSVSVPVWTDQVKIWTVAETKQIVKKAKQKCYSF